MDSPGKGLPLRKSSARIQQLRASRRSARVLRLLGPVALALAISACHFVFGDYEVQQDAVGSGGGDSGSGGGDSGSGGGDSGSGGGDSSGSGGADPGTEGDCTLGDVLCHGQSRDQCTATGWSPIELCPENQFCDAARGCVDCIAPAQRCDGQGLSECAEDGTWAPGTPCATPMSCEERADEQTAACVACSVGEEQCIGQNLMICNVAQNGWDGREECTEVCLTDPEPHCKQCDWEGQGVCTRPDLLRICRADLALGEAIDCPDDSCVTEGDSARCSN